VSNACFVKRRSAAGAKPRGRSGTGMLGASQYDAHVRVKGVIGAAQRLMDWSAALTTKKACVPNSEVEAPTCRGEQKKAEKTGNTMSSARAATLNGR